MASVGTLIRQIRNPLSPLTSVERGQSLSLPILRFVELKWLASKVCFVLIFRSCADPLWFEKFSPFSAMTLLSPTEKDVLLFRRGVCDLVFPLTRACASRDWFPLPESLTGPPLLNLPRFLVRPCASSPVPVLALGCKYVRAPFGRAGLSILSPLL